MRTEVHRVVMVGEEAGPATTPTVSYTPKGIPQLSYPTSPLTYTLRCVQQVITVQDASGWPTLSAIRP